VTAEDLAQLSPYLTSNILRFGAYATDELHIPPDVFDPAGRGRLWRRTARGRVAGHGNAAEGGLAPPNAGRHWRAENPPSLTQHA
jgi:hypothetical protein